LHGATIKPVIPYPNFTEEFMQTYPNIEIKEAPWLEFKNELSDIRRRVFIEEQKVSEDLEWEDDSSEAKLCHLLVQCKEQAIACARIALTGSNAGKISRMAVLASHRGQNIGKQLLQACVQRGLQHQLDSISLNAQLSAEGFYNKLGFISEGDIFLDAGIEHRHMRFQYSSNALENIFEDKVWRFERLNDLNQHLSLCIQSSLRNIDILSQNLEHDLYDHLLLAEKLSGFVRSNRHSNVRIILQDGEQLNLRSSEILALARRLSSSIQIRILNEEYGTLNEAFALFDNDRIVYLNNETNCEGFVNYNDRANVKNLKERFQSLWDQYSTEDRNFATFII
jgi:predicted GNAT family N-acyltransferase